VKVLVNALARFAFFKSSRDLKRLRRWADSESPSAESEISYTVANPRSDLFLLCANLRQQFAAACRLTSFQEVSEMGCGATLHDLSSYFHFPLSQLKWI